MDPTGPNGVPVEEDILESHDDYDAFKARKRDIPLGYIVGNWHKLRLRMIIAVPMILLMLFAMLFTAFVSIVLGKYGVLLDSAAVWDWILPIAGTIACAAGLVVMFRWWPTEERVGPLRILAYGAITTTGFVVVTYGVLGLIGIITGDTT